MEVNKSDLMAILKTLKSLEKKINDILDKEENLTPSPLDRLKKNLDNGGVDYKLSDGGSMLTYLSSNHAKYICVNTHPTSKDKVNFYINNGENDHVDLLTWQEAFDLIFNDWWHHRNKEEN